MVVLFPLQWFSAVLSCFIGKGGGGAQIPCVKGQRGVYRLSDLQNQLTRLRCQKDDVPKLMEVLMELTTAAQHASVGMAPGEERDNLWRVINKGLEAQERFADIALRPDWPAFSPTCKEVA